MGIPPYRSVRRVLDRTPDQALGVHGAVVAAAEIDFEPRYADPIVDLEALCSQTIGDLYLEVGIGIGT